jgi:hypothetical protein
MTTSKKRNPGEENSLSPFPISSAVYLCNQYRAFAAPITATFITL